MHLLKLMKSWLCHHIDCTFTCSPIRDTVLHAGYDCLADGGKFVGVAQKELTRCIVCCAEK